jgi:hypothetical protein
MDVDDGFIGKFIVLSGQLVEEMRKKDVYIVD